MMPDTHRPEEERARPIYKRAKGPKGASGRAPLQSPKFLKSSFRVVLLLRPPFSRLSVSLVTDHDQVEFLGTDVPGL